MFFSEDGISLRYLLLHPAVWFVVATVVLIFTAIHVWDRHQDRIIHQGGFEITADKFEINSPPPWIHTDLNQQMGQVFSEHSSLLDLELVPVVAEYLQTIPWVQQVERISKTGDGLRIRLRYRTPIALLDVRSSAALAVDAEGVIFDWDLLDSDQAAHFENELMRISMPRLDLSQVQPWQITMDDRITQAARLCDFLRSEAKRLQLYRVVTYDLPSLAPGVRPQFEIWTRNGTRVVWGSAPGFESPGQPLAVVKLGVLVSYTQSEGSLADFPDPAAFKIDVTKGDIQMIKAERSAELPEMPMVDLIK